MLFSWNKDLEIGNEMIDTQHRMLMLLLRKLHIAITHHLDHKFIMGIFLEIKKFTEFHFLSEENLMHELRYPGLEEHEKTHSELLSQLSLFIAKINRHQELPEDTLDVIHTWFANHVVSQDLKIANHLKKSEFRPLAEECYGLYLK